MSFILKKEKNKSHQKKKKNKKTFTINIDKGYFDQRKFLSK